jgi:hypothetical protein
VGQPNNDGELVEVEEELQMLAHGEEGVRMLEHVEEVGIQRLEHVEVGILRLEHVEVGIQMLGMLDDEGLQMLEYTLGLLLEYGVLLMLV